MNDSKNNEMEAFFRDLLLRGAYIDKSRIYYYTNLKYSACSPEEKLLVLEFPVLEWEMNTWNVMQGGILATLFDMSFGILTRYYTDGVPPASVSLSVSYLKPVKCGDTIYIKSRILSLGKTLVTIYGEAVSGETGKVAASATSTLMRLAK